MPMELHHRAVFKGWNNGDLFIRETCDIGYPWGMRWEDYLPTWHKHNDMKKRWDNVKVETRDAG